MSSRYDFQIHTYGCKVNTYDTGLLHARLANEQAAAAQAASSADPAARPVKPKVHILNTCAVTAEATREAARQVRRLKSREPLSKIVVTGCGAQVDGATFDLLPGVDLVVANSHKGQLESLLDEMFKGRLTERVFRSNIFRKDDLEAGGGVEPGHTRTFLKIQDGCNSFCTYCVIPFARGKSRSLPVADLLKRVREFHEQGIQEVVLTGVHIGDYEDAAGGRKRLLHNLVAELLSRTKIARLRLSSLEPPELTPELLALYADPRLCPHFHMSIQSANTRVLRLMKRTYTAEDVECALNKIKDQVPGAFVGMDVIVGFPGETEDEFADTYGRLASLPWTRIHVFPYSERPGTRAALFEGALPAQIRNLRSQRLRELSTGRFEKMAREQVGSLKQVLILRSSAGDRFEGLSRDYWPFRFQASSLMGKTSGEIWAQVDSYDRSQTSRMDGVLLGHMIQADEGLAWKS